MSAPSGTEDEAPLAWVRRVAVGSQKAPKVAAARDAFAAYCGVLPEVAGTAVESGVGEQPVGYGEIVAGARNRARAARRLVACDLAVGIEDGLVEVPEAEELGGRWLNVGAAVVSDGVRDALGLSSGFAYPPEIAGAAALGGLPIGDTFDRLWRERRGDKTPRPSGEGEGNIGKLSLGVLTRAEYGRQAVVCALVQWLHPDLYAGSHT